MTIILCLFKTHKYIPFFPTFEMLSFFLFFAAADENHNQHVYIKVSRHVYSSKTPDQK